MATRPHRTALVGCGLISRSHLQAYAAFAGRAEVAWCVDLDLDRAQAMAETCGARATDSLDEVLADPEVDAVEVLTPHHAHEGPTLAALAAGKAVLLQKPLAHDRAAAQRIAEAARRATVPLVYGEMSQTSPSVAAVRAALEAGQVGQVVAIQATYAHFQSGEVLRTPWRYDPSLAGGGALLDGGIHYVNILRQFGGPVRTVQALTRQVRPELGGEDTSALLLEFESGVLGTLLSTHASRRWPDGPSVTVYGTDALVVLDGPWAGARLLRGREDPVDELHTGRVPLFESMLEALLDAMDGEPNRAPVEAGLADLAIVEAAYQSARSGRRERVEDLT